MALHCVWLLIVIEFICAAPEVKKKMPESIYQRKIEIQWGMEKKV